MSIGADNLIEALLRVGQEQRAYEDERLDKGNIFAMRNAWANVVEARADFKEALDAYIDERIAMAKRSNG